jgi:hypothetical protein
MTSNKNTKSAKRFPIPSQMLCVTCAATLLSGCAAIPLNRLQPLIAPTGSACQSEKGSFLANELTDNTFRYQLPSRSITNQTSGSYFETYYAAVEQAVSDKLPPQLKQHKVVKAFTEYLASSFGEAQLDAQVTAGALMKVNSITDDQYKVEKKAIKKHSAPSKLTHGEMKDFADKLFEFQLKSGPASFAGSHAAKLALIAEEDKTPDRTPLDTTFVQYLDAYYKGQFVDRMGTTVDKPTISSTIPDSEMAAAETVLLEVLIDSIDPTPVMGNADSVDSNTVFYPGGSKSQPTAYTVNKSIYLKIPTPSGDPYPCGITTTNVWVLRDVANGASEQAAAVGGLVANTPGGIGISLGVFGKISIGDNQTLSVLVKTAASRVALRAALASSYATLRHFKFNVTEP